MIINEKLIELELDSDNRVDIIDRLCDIAYDDGKLKNKEDFKEKVLLREKKISTDLGQGIAIPHGKSDSVKEPFIMFVKLKDPVVWNELEHTNIDLVFMIGVPENGGSNIHLKLISQIATKVVDDEFINKLRTSTDKKTVLNFFNKIKI